MPLLSFLDHWDERRAAADDGFKLPDRPAVDAKAAFDNAAGDESACDLGLLVSEAIRSKSFFDQPTAAEYDFRFDGEILSFRSAVSTETANNNTACARIVERRKQKTAVVILPHWGAPSWSYRNVSGHFARLGLTAVEVTLPYHGQRSREGAYYPDYFLSSNLGRTIRSVRQAVLDTRSVIDWLTERGHSRIAVIGLSLGSCIGGLVAAHDPRVSCSALLLTAGDFAEVVWTGRATRHIRKSLEPAMRLEQLRSIWSIISTHTYTPELGRPGHKLLIVNGRRDPVVLPYLTERFVQQLCGARAELKWAQLGCGHYSLGLFPFNVAAFVGIVRFFTRSGLLR